jgi:hypothetical protein
MSFPSAGESSFAKRRADTAAATSYGAGRSFAERAGKLRARRIDAEEIIRDDLMLQPTGDWARGGLDLARSARNAHRFSLLR